MAKLINPTLKLIRTDPDSAEFDNPLGPMDPIGLREQVDQSDVTGALKAASSREVVARPGYYPDRQG